MVRTAIALALALAYASAACAQAADAALRNEVNDLKTRIEAIEKRLGAISDVSPASAAAPSAPSPFENWRRVRQGMTREQVKSLVGEPSKAFELDGSHVWYYRYEAGAAGSVFFDSAGRASSFQRP